MRAAVESLRERIDADGIPLEVLTGGEVSVEVASAAPAEELAGFGLGGNAGYLLVETPYVGWPLTLPQLVSQLAADGVRPVLAHPERNPRVQERPEELAPLVSAGALVQVIAGSLTGDFGDGVAHTARRLVELELVHLLASDQHAPTRRTSLARALEGLEPELGAWLTEAVPRAIVESDELPARPAGGRRRRRPFGRPRRRA